MTDYEKAIAVHDRACRIYQGALEEYRLVRGPRDDVADATFLAARATFDAATATFDAAFAVERDRGTST